MSRFEQERSEVESHLPRFGIRLSDIRPGSEPPDILFDLEGLEIGVEVTRYAADEDQRILEAAWREVLGHANRLIDDDDPIRRIDVTLGLTTERKLPPRRDRQPFARTLVEFLVGWWSTERASEEVSYSTIAELPVVGAYVDELTLIRADYWSEWHCLEAHSHWKPDPAEVVRGMVIKKAAKHVKRASEKESGFSECDEYWLLIHGHAPIDATIAIINPDLLTQEPLLARALSESPFDRVCISGIDAAEWRRDVGWRYLDSRC